MHLLKFKKITTSVLLATSIFASGTVRAQGIPVIDTANLIQAIQEILAWYQQYEQMYQQLQLAQKQLENASGSRGLGTINNAITNSTIDTDFVAKLATSSKDQSRALMHEQLTKIAQTTNTRFGQIQLLMNRINQTNDQKSISEMIARIQSEQAMIALESKEIETIRFQYDMRIRQLQEEAEKKISQAAMQGGYK